MRSSQENKTESSLGEGNKIDRTRTKIWYGYLFPLISTRFYQVDKHTDVDFILVLLIKPLCPPGSSHLNIVPDSVSNS